MRTTLLVLLLLALCVPTAAALAIPGARIEVGLPALNAAVDGASATVVTPPVPLRLPATLGLDPVQTASPLELTARIPAHRPSAPLADLADLTRGAQPASLPPPAPAEPMPAPVQAAAATGILWLIVERLGFGRALVGALAALYFRVQPNELLENERRERVIQLVRERPGIGPQDLANALGTGWGVTSYHLDRLERAGLITSQRVGHHRCYFLPGAVARDQQRTVGLIRADTARRVATLLVERPGLTQTELCGALGLSASAASKQVARLEDAALLRREPGERGARLYPEAGLVGALAPA